MIKLQSKYNHKPGTLVRIHKTNSYGLVISKTEAGDYNILPLKTSKWNLVRVIQIWLIKKLLNQTT
jgi:hypothetical protein